MQVTSKGQLVKHGRLRANGQILISQVFHVTKEMLPSFRIVAYYHTGSNEVVSDSVWVDVKDTCMGSVRHASSNPHHRTHERITKLLNSFSC